ncbi:hypothetical protein [Paracoccus sp. SY]|uniref:hypothetical protein n=1 Tax=Paracoccus sp. SY TaxID=1330255 RepID=UPI001304EDAD|nr:hypothetical protein [Paracoccus sp. SY]
MTMPGRSFHRGVGPVPAEPLPAQPVPIVDFGVPAMFDIQTELHLRRTGRPPQGDDSGTIRAILIVANLAALALLAAVLI